MRRRRRRPWRGASARAWSGSSASTRRAASRSSRPSQRGPLSSHCAATTALAVERRAPRSTCVEQRRLDRPRARAAAPRTRRRPPSRRMSTRPTPHCCTTAPGALRHAAALEPGVAAAERRMAGERQLAARREDAHAVVGRRVGGRRAGRSSRSGWSSARTPASARRRARRRRARRRAGCRAAAPSVKTSTWVKAKAALAPRASCAHRIVSSAAASARTPRSIALGRDRHERQAQRVRRAAPA